jgi:hypothetical protein
MGLKKFGLNGKTKGGKGGGSPFFRGFDQGNKNANRNSDFGKEILFGGKSGFDKDEELSIVFSAAEPLSYYAHNMFSIGKKGFLTCAKPEHCDLCEVEITVKDKKGRPTQQRGINASFKAAWPVKLISEDGSIEARFISRGISEFRGLEGMAKIIKKRCSVCGSKMQSLGGKRVCTKHPKAKGSTLTDWVMTLTKTGEGTSTKWNFERDELITEELRKKLDLVEDLKLEDLLAPKGPKYLEKVLADLTLGDDDDNNDDDDYEDDEETNELDDED